MLYTYPTVHFRLPILEPTLNELVGLTETQEDPWPVPRNSSESSTTSTCPLTTRRIGMKDIERPDGNLQGGPHMSLSVFDEPKFCKTDTELWCYWPASLANSTPGLAFPRQDEFTVDPWDVSSHQDPPFYRRFCTEPPYESGMADKFAMVDTHQYGEGPWIPLAVQQTGGPKTTPGSHSTSPLNSHL